MTNRNEMTWGDVFEQVANEPAPMTPAEVCAAHFSVLREILAAGAGKPLAHADLFDVAA